MNVDERVALEIVRYGVRHALQTRDLENLEPRFRANVLETTARNMTLEIVASFAATTDQRWEYKHLEGGWSHWWAWLATWRWWCLLGPRIRAVVVGWIERRVRYSVVTASGRLLFPSLEVELARRLDYRLCETVVADHLERLSATMVPLPTSHRCDVCQRMVGR